MPETTLLYTLDKKINSITFNETKACIDNVSLAIVGHRSYHTVGVFSPAQGPGIWDPAGGFGSEVLSEGSGPQFYSKVRVPESCLKVWGTSLHYALKSLCRIFHYRFCFVFIKVCFLIPKKL